jgi:hypothetical protein
VWNVSIIEKWWNDDGTSSIISLKRYINRIDELKPPLNAFN